MSWSGVSQLSLVFLWPPKEHLDKITNATFVSAFSCPSSSLSPLTCRFCRSYHMFFFSFPCWGPSHPSSHHLTYVPLTLKALLHIMAVLSIPSHMLSLLYKSIFFLCFIHILTYKDPLTLKWASEWRRICFLFSIEPDFFKQYFIYPVLNTDRSKSAFFLVDALLFSWHFSTTYCIRDSNYL